MAISCPSRRSKHWLGISTKCWALFTQLHPKPTLLAHCPSMEFNKKVWSLVATRIDFVTRQGCTYQAAFFTSKEFPDKEIFALSSTAMLLRRVLRRTSLIKLMPTILFLFILVPLLKWNMKLKSIQLYFLLGIKLRILSLSVTRALRWTMTRSCPRECPSA